MLPGRRISPTGARPWGLNRNSFLPSLCLSVLIRIVCFIKKNKIEIVSKMPNSSISVSGLNHTPRNNEIENPEYIRRRRPTGGGQAMAGQGIQESE